MKLDLISEAEYERRLQKAIARFQRGIMKPEPCGEVGRIWRIYRDAGKPLSATDVGRADGCKTAGTYDWGLFFYSGRAYHLFRNGWLREVGTRTRVVRGVNIKRDYVTISKTCIAVTTPVYYSAARIERARRLLNATLDRLEPRRMQAACMAVTARSVSMTERERMVVRARLKGLTLQEIGDAIGVTRERARQLVVKGLTGQRS